MKKCLIFLLLLLSAFWLCSPSTKARDNSDFLNKIQLLEDNGAVQDGFYLNFSSWYSNSQLKTQIDNGQEYSLMITSSTSLVQPSKFVIFAYYPGTTYVWYYNGSWMTNINYTTYVYFNNLSWSGTTQNTNWRWFQS